MNRLFDVILARNILPDWLLRHGIRHLNKKRLKKEYGANIEEQQERFMRVRDMLSQGSLSEASELANERHYELPPRFFELVLGKYLKYSSGYWDNSVFAAENSLDASEKKMIDLTMDRAELANGQEILELGCGWGSLTLSMARLYPKNKITALSNSKDQKQFIENKAKEEGLKNIKIVKEDINSFKIRKKFDRIISVEMFEHLRNYKLLFERLYDWSKPEGKLFIHVFSHRELAYLYDERDGADGMARYFFSGGTMPSNNLFLHFSSPFVLEKQWLIPGTHYHYTAEAWLKNMDRNIREIREIFAQTYGRENVKKGLSYWRIFFLTVSEFFNVRRGREWMVSHHLFRAGY